MSYIPIWTEWVAQWFIGYKRTSEVRGSNPTEVAVQFFFWYVFFLHSSQHNQALSKTHQIIGRRPRHIILKWYIINHHFYFPAQLIGGFTLSDLLDKQRSQVSSLLPPVRGTCLHFSICTDRRSRVFDISVLFFILYTSICVEMVECHL